MVQKNQNGLVLNINPIFQKLWSLTSAYKSGIRMELEGGLTLSLVPLDATLEEGRGTYLFPPVRICLPSHSGNQDKKNWINTVKLWTLTYPYSNTSQVEALESNISSVVEF